MPRLILASLCFLLVVAFTPLIAVHSQDGRKQPAATPGSVTTISVTPVKGGNTADPASSDAVNPALIIMMGVILLIIAAVPAGYLIFSQPPQSLNNLLLLSTDETTRKQVIAAANMAGYQTVSVFRYEDALEKLRKIALISMVIIDDSVPQYEVGLLVTTLQKMPVVHWPLILIQDSSELGQTAFAHRAERILQRPLTAKALEAAIRQTGEAQAKAKLAGQANPTNSNKR